MGILDEATPVGQIKPYVKAVIYGDGGVGKTTWAASAPNPTWIDFERSFEALRVIPDGDKIKAYIPPSTAKLREYTEAAIKKYDTIVFDTVTSFQVFYMREYLEKKAGKSVPSEGIDKDFWVPTQPDYNYATNELTDFFLMLQHAECNVIWLAHMDVTYVKNDKGQDTTTIYKVRPGMTPKVWENLRLFVNVVAYMEKAKPLGKPETRRLYFNSTQTIQAKNRLGIQETFIENPKFEDIFKLTTKVN